MKVAILGLGYRADFFVRAIERIEGLEIVGALVRSLDSIERAKNKYNIKAALSKEYILSLKPDFIINTAAKAVNSELSEYFLSNGIPVLQETPVALNNEQIDLLMKYKGLYQIAEQYQFYDYFQEIKKYIELGYLGDINELSISYAHDYHGISIIRHILGDFKTLKMFGTQFKSKIAHTKTRYESFEDGMELEYKSKHILMNWDNKRVKFDFNSEEYRSTIRNPYICIRGSRGEIINDKINFLDKHNVCQHMNIIGFNSYDDNIPVERVIRRMMSFVETKEEFYPLEYARDDAKLSIIMNSFDETLKEVEYKR